MQEDGFIREVNEDLRKDKLRDFWRSYGRYIIASIFLIIFAAAVHQTYKYSQLQKANRSSEIMTSLLGVENLDDATLAKIEEVKSIGSGIYPLLADLKYAELLANKGENTAALKIYDALLANNSTPDFVKKVARVSSSYLMLETSSYDDIFARVGSLALEGTSFEYVAKEILGYSAFYNGDKAKALELFEQLYEADTGDPDMHARVSVMLSQLRK